MLGIEEQKQTQRGKHSWLPLSLLTPAVRFNLHSNKTWQHCAELIFEVVIFNTRFLYLFTAVFCENAFVCVCLPPFESQLPRNYPSAVRCHQSVIWNWSLKGDNHSKWNSYLGKTSLCNNLFAHIFISCLKPKIVLCTRHEEMQLKFACCGGYMIPFGLNFNPLHNNSPTLTV